MVVSLHYATKLDTCPPGQGFSNHDPECRNSADRWRMAVWPLLPIVDVDSPQICYGSFLNTTELGLHAWWNNALPAPGTVQLEVLLSSLMRVTCCCCGWVEFWGSVGASAVIRCHRAKAGRLAGQVGSSDLLGLCHFVALFSNVFIHSFNSHTWRQSKQIVVFYHLVKYTVDTKKF